MMKMEYISLRKPVHDSKEKNQRLDSVGLREFRQISRAMRGRVIDAGEFGMKMHDESH